jgi:hypothetical protein
MVYASPEFEKKVISAGPADMRNEAIDIKKLTDLKQAEKLDKLSELMVKLITDEFTGHIKINFSQGGIGRVEKFEEILKA